MRRSKNSTFYDSNPCFHFVLNEKHQISIAFCWRIYYNVGRFLLIWNNWSSFMINQIDLRPISHDWTWLMTPIFVSRNLDFCFKESRRIFQKLWWKNRNSITTDSESNYFRLWSLKKYIIERFLRNYVCLNVGAKFVKSSILCSRKKYDICNSLFKMHLVSSIQSKHHYFITW